MSHNSLRFGLIGTGRIGQVHAANIAASPDATLTWVADPFVEGAHRLASAFGGTATENSEEVFASGQVDAILIASPTPTHVDLIAKAVDAGIPVFCEKPIDLDIARVEALGPKIAAAGVPVALGFNRRFDPAFASVRERVARGEIGTLEQLTIISRDPGAPPAAYIAVSGGIFRDMTIHDFDMARFVVASEVVEVFARGAVRVDPGFAEANDVDTAVVMLEHANGCLTTIDNSRQAVYGYDQRVEVFGSAGVASSENPAEHTGIVRTADGLRAPTLPYFFLERYIPSYLREWQAFVSSVIRGEAPSVGPGDARAPLVIGLAAWRSVREGRSVRIEELDG
jgi:myo-inositol 2-dehydrogenase/D-chiro-inositol 1-dehydrogenase